MPPRELPHDHLALDQPDRLRLHDFIGRLVLQQPVLVNAGRMGEGVRPDDRLVRLHHHAGDLADQPAGLRDLFGMNLRIGLIEVFPGAKPHDNFFQRRIPGSLADSIDRALDLACPFEHRSQTIPHGEAKVVVAMDGDHRLRTIWHLLANAANEPPEFLWHRIADRIGNIDRPGSCGNHRLDHFIEIGGIGTAGIHGRELHIVHVAPRPLHHFDRALLRLVARHSELMLQMDIRGREKRMDTDLGRPLQGLPGSIDILRPRPSQAANRRSLDLLRNPPDRFKVSRRTIGKSRFDDIDPQASQLLRHHDLLFHIHAGARRLLSIAQGRIENSDHPSHGFPLLPIALRLLKAVVQQGRRRIETGGVPSGVR